MKKKSFDENRECVFSQNQILKFESQEKIIELQAQIQNLTNQISSMKIEHKCFLNKLNRYIDTHQETSCELEAIYSEAKNFDYYFEEDKSDVNLQRRNDCLNEIENNKCNEFSQVSMDSYHALNNEGVNLVSAICGGPKSEDDKEDKYEDILDLQKIKSCNQKPNPYRKTSCKIFIFVSLLNFIFFKVDNSNCKAKFLKGLKNTVVCFGLSNSGNVMKRSNEPMLKISNTKKNPCLIKKSHINFIFSNEEDLDELKKSHSMGQQPIINDDLYAYDMSQDDFLDEIEVDDNEEYSLNIKKSVEKSFATKLFENFVIIGADPKELEESDEKYYRMNRMTPKLLYDFDSSSKDFEENNPK